MGLEEEKKCFRFFTMVMLVGHDVVWSLSSKWSRFGLMKVIVGCYVFLQLSFGVIMPWHVKWSQQMSTKLCCGPILPAGHSGLQWTNYVNSAEIPWLRPSTKQTHHSTHINLTVVVNILGCKLQLGVAFHDDKSEVNFDKELSELPVKVCVTLVQSDMNRFRCFFK